MRDREHLLGIVRGELPRLKLVCEEKRMFGGVTMMLAGNMLCCVSRQGLMVRVGMEGEAAALTLPGAQPCMGTGRRMAGFVMVSLESLKSAQDVEDWLRLAHAFVGTLPTKQKNSKQPPKKE